MMVSDEKEEKSNIEEQHNADNTQEESKDTETKSIDEQSREKLEDNGVDPDSKYGKVLMYIDKVGKYLKIPLLSLLTCSGFFIFIYLIAWTLNAVHPNIHFDLGSLRDFYLYVIGAKSVDHGVNSIFNTPRGKPPIQ